MSTDPMQKFGKDSMDMAMTTFGAWTKNAQAIATEFAGYSKRSFEDFGGRPGEADGREECGDGRGGADGIPQILV